MEHQRFSFLLNRSDVGHRRWPSFRGHGATHRVLLNFVIKSFRSHHGYSSYATRITLACYRLEQGVILTWSSWSAMSPQCGDRLLVTAPADCSSAIHPKVQHRPTVPASDPVSSQADRILGIDGHQASGGATHSVSLNLGTFSFSMFASWPQVSAVCP